jgi:NAD(P)H-hydrate epimerase
MNVCVKADLTIAVQEYKTGHFFNDGKDFSGHVKAKDIGISIWEEDFAFRFRHKDVAKYFPKRKENTHKGDYPKVGVIGGSKDFFGSVMLSHSALAGLCSGAGYSYLIVPESLYSIYAGVNPECIIKTLKDDGNNFVADESVIDKIKNLDAVAFGMGVGVTEEVYKLLTLILKNYTGKLLIDADALNSLAKYGLDILRDKKCDVIVTPHLKEFSRLTGKTVDEIRLDPIGITKGFAQEYGVVVVLKSATTIITDGKHLCINVTGTPALAKAGSGDVLSGIITALASTHGVFEGACVGAYIFGKAGGFCAKEYGEYSVTATKVTDAIGKVIAVL